MIVWDFQRILCGAELRLPTNVRVVYAKEIEITGADEENAYQGMKKFFEETL